MGAGGLDTTKLERAVRRMAKRAVLFDVARGARDNGSVINAVILGAIAGTGVLPIPAETFERAIRAEGKSVDANLRGFAYGLKAAKGDIDRKSTRLNSSHQIISYAVFCLKKKKSTQPRENS